MLPSTDNQPETIEHPSLDALLAFANGLANSTQATWIEEHVSNCETCSASLANAPEDGLVELLRAPLPISLAQSDPLQPIETTQETDRTRSSFQIVKPLGRGGMGIVYLAWQQSLQRHVALKTIARGDLARPEDLRRFQREAEAAASLRHENIAQVYEVGEQDGNPYIAMELVQGCTLSKYLANGPLPLSTAVKLLIQLAGAIDHAHSKSIIHRDLKPSNILLDGCTPDEKVQETKKTSDLHPKIVDFGLAKRVGQLDSPTLTGDLIGTPSYMSPEQAIGDTPSIGVGSDIYALGAILYEVLVGRPPFQGSGPVETLEQVRSQEPVRPTSLRAGIPIDLETICLKCLEKQLSQRYASASDLLDDLLRFHSGRPISARPASWMTRAIKWTKRRPALAALFALLVLGASGFLTIVIIHNRSMRVALKETQEEKARANTNFQFAIRSIEQMLERVGFDQLTDRPAMEEVRAKLLTDAVGFYSELLSIQPESDVESKRLYYRALSRQGNILRALGKNAPARESLQKAINLQTQLLKEYPKDADIQYELGVSHISYGLIDLGADSFRTAIELLKAIESTTPQSRRDLAQAISNLGTAATKMDEQEVHHQSALRLRQKLLTEAPDDSRLQFGMGQTLYNLGLLYYRTDRSPEGADSLKRAIDIFERLVEQQGEVTDYQFSLAECYASYASVLFHLGNTNESLQMSENGTSLRKTLSERFPKVPTLRQSLGRSYLTHVTFLLPQNRFVEAMQLSQKGLNIAEQLNRDVPRRDHRIFVAASLTILATSASGVPDMETARTAFERATRLYDELLEEDPSDEYCLSEAGVNCMNYSNVLRPEDPLKALEYNDRSVEILAKLSQGDPKRQDYRSYFFNACGARAQTLEVLKRYSDAATAWAKLVELSSPESKMQFELLEALALARSGSIAEAASIGNRLIAAEGLGGADLYNLACLFGVIDSSFAQSRDREANPAEASSAYSEAALKLLNHPTTLQFLREEVNRKQLAIDPDLRTIRTNPAFAELLIRLGQ